MPYDDVGQYRWVDGQKDYVAVHDDVAVMSGARLVTAYDVCGRPVLELPPSNDEMWEHMRGDRAVYWDRTARRRYYLEPNGERAYERVSVDEVGRPTSDEPDERDPDVDLKVAQLRRRLLSVEEMAKLPPPEPLIENVLMRGGLAVLWGKPGSGKTFVALDWGLNVAVGAWWFGREVRQGGVLYLAAEGSGGLNQRVQAWMTDRRVYRVGPEQFSLLPETVNLLDRQWAEAMVVLTATMAPALVIADTLARSMVGGDENTSRDMGVLINVANRVQEASGAAVLFVHHDTKEGSTMRGSSALLGAVDTCVECRADGQAVMLKCEKQKDARPFEPIRLWRSEVSGSCVIHSHEGVGVTEELTAAQEALRRAAWECCGSDGLPPSKLQAAAEQSNSTFYRSLKALVTAGELVNIGSEKRPRYRPPEGVTS